MTAPIHPAVNDVVRHANAGFPLMAVELVGTEQERFAASFAQVLKGKTDVDLLPLWFDIARWPNIMNLMDNTMIPAVESTKEDSPDSPFGDEGGNPADAAINAINWIVAQARHHKEALRIAKDNDPVPPRMFLLMNNVQRFFALDGMYENVNLLCQTLRNAVLPLKAVGFGIIFVGTSTPANPAIDRLITRLPSALPTQAELVSLAQDIRKAAEMKPLSEDDAHKVGDALRGMTWFEAENILALLASECSGDSAPFDTLEITRKKKEIIDNIPGVEMFEPRDYDDPKNLIGLKHALDVIMATTTGKPKHPRARVKGYILNGLPGTGKSDLCRKLAWATGRTVLRWNPKNSQGSLVGQTEENVQMFFKVAEAIGAIIIVDEADSAFSGGTDGRLDGGVMKGMIGATQTFMQDNENCVMFFTTNNLDMIPGPMKRGGRVDEIFWFGYPSREELVKMFTDVWCHHYGYKLTEGELDDLNLDKWVGADVEAAVRKAVGRGRRLGEINFAPSYLVMGGDLDAWKRAAHGNVDATTGEVMVWNGKDLVPQKGVTSGVVTYIGSLTGSQRKIKRNKT